MRKLVIGILAHVDAGKTTLAEGLLYQTGSIRKLGRVDHKDAFLDTYELERARGITIFSKQAVVAYQDIEVSLLDTPGHVDFSSEMERTLQVLDYAILVISGSEGIQGHTQTLWRLLARYGIPTFLFVNKMDLEGADHDALLAELKNRLSEGCADFTQNQETELFMENLAMCDDALLEQYMETGEINTDEIKAQIAARRIFPCYFGSALRLEGIENLLEGLKQYTRELVYPEEFGAKVYKIGRDDQGNRLTYLKVTGGNLKVKMLLTNQKENEVDQADLWEEKVDQIRIYTGAKFGTTEEVKAGTVCAVTGLTRTYPGEGLGMESVSDLPMLEPVLNYQVILPPGCDVHTMLMKLRQLEDEDPQLHIHWSEQLGELSLQLMGEVQVDILKSIILDRFGISVEFGTGAIVYKETIQNSIVGIGHFEPLRHYAEVHLLLEPGEQGSGLSFDTDCSEDELDRSWQRLVLTHLEEKTHPGVLIGAPITDMRITLIAGRAHLAHTEGGDFRQATYRAIRQGLKKAKCILLEPYYHFRLEIPSDTVGRAMSDIQRMCGEFQAPEQLGELAVLTGTAPVATMRGYQLEVTAYTRGRGRLFCTLKGYEPCHNSEEVIDRIGYDSERDLDNPTGSVFCSHGAGFVVTWDKVEEYMHLENGWQPEEAPNQEPEAGQDPPLPVTAEVDISGRQTGMTAPDRISSEQNGLNKKPSGRSDGGYRGSLKEDKELEDIFVRTFGPVRNKLSNTQGSLGYEKSTVNRAEQVTQTKQGSQKKFVSLTEQEQKDPRKEYLLVDGYNVIFSWEELNALAKENMDAARTKLMDILCNYQGFKKCILILVFDAYKVKGSVGELQEYHNIHVVYTKEAETADTYIEKVTHEIAREHQVTVATSDALEQLIIMGQGAIRYSSADLKEEILRVNELIRKDYLEKQPTGRVYLKDRLGDNILDILDKTENEK